MAKNVFGRRVAEERRRKSLSQKALAKKAKVSQTFLSQVESGVIQEPGLMKSARLAKSLGVALDELLGGRRRHASDSRRAS